MAAAASFDQPQVRAATAVLLATGLVPSLFLGSRTLIGAVTACLAMLHQPGVRFGLLGAAGMVLLVGSQVLTDKHDEATLEDLQAEVEFMEELGPVRTCERARAATDRGTPVVLKEPATLRVGIDPRQLEDSMLKGVRLDDQVIRRRPADERCNCHGWVFTGGQFIVSGLSVDQILEENGYGEVTGPKPGDLVVYRTGVGIIHSAIVRYVTEGEPVLVEGKWGQFGVFLHPVEKSVYGTTHAFYRSSRAGHLLAGLEAPPPLPTHSTDQASEQ